MKHSLKPLVITQLLLLLSTVVVWGFVHNDPGFGMLLVMVPFFLMFIAGIVGFIALLVRVYRNSEPNSPMQRIREVAILVLFAWPVYVLASSMAGTIVGTMTLGYIILLGLYILTARIRASLDLLFNTILLVLPIGLIIYASTIDDSNLLTMSMGFGGLLVIPSIFNLWKLSKTHHRL